MESLINEGVKLGVSSRGIGSLKQTREGVNIVGDDFMLSTAYDIVSDPSALMLSLKVLWKVRIGFGMVVSSVKSLEKTYKQINTFVDQKQLDEKKLDLFNDFLNNL